MATKKEFLINLKHASERQCPLLSPLVDEPVIILTSVKRYGFINNASIPAKIQDQVQLTGS